MTPSAQTTLTLGALAKQLELSLQGDSALQISGVASFGKATSTQLCFLNAPKYLDKALASECAAVIVPLNFEGDIAGKSLLFSGNPHLSFVKAISLLHPEAVTPLSAGIHPSASVHPTAQLADDVHVGANSVIGANARIAARVMIAEGCVIDAGCVIGSGSRLHPNVTICHDCQIGARVILHPGAVIGSDGFGLVYDNGEWVKIPHLGSVQIGDDVEIGANTTVDRGALDDTIIERGVKLDNLIQVAHNVVIGENTAIAGCVGIAGSAVIGKNCRISGAAIILGHLSVADNTTVTAMSMVTKSITESGTYSSGTPLMENRLWRRTSARYKMLDQLAKDLAKLEKNKEDSK